MIILFIVLAAFAAAIFFVWEYYVTDQKSSSDTDNKFIVGLILTDEEDTWHAALNKELTNIEDMDDVEVMTIETNRTQAAQIEALRSFIVYKVDVIIFSPVMENGWGFVLDEAKEAKIPIITVEKKLAEAGEQTKESKVYYVGYDYFGLGVQMADVIETQWKDEKPRIVELQGTVASSSSREITQGIRSVLDQNKQYQLYYSIGANYMRSRAYELIVGLIRNNYSIDIIISHNDAMTLGVLDALNKYAIRPGKDIYLFSFGGEPEVYEAYNRENIHCLVRFQPAEIAKGVRELIRSFKEYGSFAAATEKNRIFQGELLVYQKNNESDENNGEEEETEQ